MAANLLLDGKLRLDAVGSVDGIVDHTGNRLSCLANRRQRDAWHESATLCIDAGEVNVAGTFNRVPEAVNIQVVLGYDPGFNKLGLLYNGNEENSVIKRDELAALAPTLGIDLVALEIQPGASGPPDPDQIPKRMAELAAAGVEWLYLGSSSFLRQNGNLFTESAVEHGIAVVSPYEALVRESSALLSIAAREEDVGRLAARQALAILRDDKIPGELPILSATDFAYVVNMDVARELDRIPPFAFLQVASTVQR